MPKRKPLPPKIRYEVFKRDGFKCQYCGRSAPDVILEVDHIVPVAKGGENDILNLITSCRDCNRGKGKGLLTESEILKKQKAELEELNERREQMEMMIQWKTELRSLENRQVEEISNLILQITEYAPNRFDKQEILRVLKRYPYSEVYTATEISFDRYYTNQLSDLRTEYLRQKAFTKAVEKIGGICYNRRKQGDV